MVKKTQGQPGLLANHQSKTQVKAGLPDILRQKSKSRFASVSQLTNHLPLTS
jgi:hypothetical protein